MLIKKEKDEYKKNMPQKIVRTVDALVYKAELRGIGTNVLMLFSGF